MPTAGKPWWQQATALVSLGAGGAITGFSFVPGSAADLTSPSGMPIHLQALELSARHATSDDAKLRSAILNVATYYLRMAATKTAAEMEAIIWQRDSLDGVDHGASCAAFASLTLELGANVVGQESWVTGGTTYPWPLHKWADVRVNPNPSSLGVTSIVQDAQSHHRWHPLGDGYQPLPGDWVVFDGHVEVVTDYAGGVLRTIGGDSVPDFSVNAHAYSNAPAADGVLGFVDNGGLATPANTAAGSGAQAVSSGGQTSDGQAQDQADPVVTIPGAGMASASQRAAGRAAGGAAIPGMPPQSRGASKHGHPTPSQRQQAAEHTSPSSQPRQEPEHTSPGSQSPAPPHAAATGTAVIPGLPIMAHHLAAGPASSATPYHRHRPPPPAAPVRDASAQQAFIGEVAPGAVAAQRRYGVPASVTIAQAIDESGWGQSQLAVKDHNLFGIKGMGPAGTDPQPTSEYVDGQQVTITKTFRVYNNTAESIEDHGRLLATSHYYRTSMADRRDPNAFAASLAGVYATDPRYGEKLIGIMRRYDLYRYDTISPAPVSHSTAPGTLAIPGLSGAGPAPSGAAAAHSHTTAAPSATGAAPSQPAAAPSATHTVKPETAAAPSATVAAPSHTAAAPSATRTGRSRAAAAPSAPGAGTASSGAGVAPSDADAPAGAGTDSTAARSAPSASPAAQAPSPSAAAAPVPQSAAAQQIPSAAPSAAAASARRIRGRVNGQAGRTSSARARKAANRYQPEIPAPVMKAFVARARAPLIRAEPLYRDVADHSGIRWELLAACDWMQCGARPRHSPVHGEKLGAVNPDGTSYRTKSEALAQCAEELAELAQKVYRIDLTVQRFLSVRDLANAFAAFRWGGLLKLHRTSAMEFPYSVAGLTEQHMKMRWPNIDDPNTPDKPGARFRMPFGAVPIVLSLNYPATV